MSLHRPTSLEIGVRDVSAAVGYYRDFGLTGDERGPATLDGGEQFRFVASPTRRLLGIGIGAANCIDLEDFVRS